MQFPRHPLASAAALAALLSPLSAQQDWVEWDSSNGAAANELYGFALTGLGDWNQDGYDDYAVSSPGSDAGGLNSGHVTIRSGFDGSVLTQIDGMASSDQLGYSLCSLGEHSDGMPKIAIGAPFQTSVNGPFTGLVRVYAWDNVAGAVFLLQEISGTIPGSLFGWDLAGSDLDGDGDLDLGVGAPGSNGLDGQVLGFTMSSAGASEPASWTFDGAASSGEGLGWSIDRALDVSGVPGVSVDGLVAGAPFAMDLAAEDGAVALLSTSGSITTLSNPIAGTADAHLGYSVAGGQDAVGGSSSDVAAGAPDAGNGRVVIWSGDTLAPTSNILGANAGEQFGLAIAMTDDSNFDLRGDLLVGAPGFSNDRGRFEAFSLVPSTDSLVSGLGEAGDTGRYGFSVAALGDINQTTKTEAGVGAPDTQGGQGLVEIHAPPAQDLGPVVLTAVSTYVWETNVDLLATNLAPGGGGQLYWYVGNTNNPSTSPEGYDLDISGNLQLIAIDVNPGTQAQQSYLIQDTLPDGTNLFFQMVEDRNGFIRTSSVDGGSVVDPGVSLFMVGNQAGGPLRFETKWGIPNSPIYYYATAAGVSAQANQPAPNGSWNLNLRNARYVGQPGDKSDLEGASISSTLTVPPGFVGVTAFFQAYDWDLFTADLTNVVEITFQ